MASPIIYCDMDGVLADFKTAAVKVNGMSINRWMNIPSSREKWERIKNTSNFWHNLPWMPGGQALWRFLTKFDPHILSAYVEDKNIQSKTVIVVDTKNEENYYINELKNKGKIIGKGYGSLTNQIRIANFPTHSKEAFESLCDELNLLK